MILGKGRRKDPIGLFSIVTKESGLGYYSDHTEVLVFFLLASVKYIESAPSGHDSDGDFLILIP
jgi:hypothetical protein